MKVVKQNNIDDGKGEFEEVAAQRPPTAGGNRGGDRGRGGRGGRGGDRGGRGGERGARGGERGGRGGERGARVDRPRTAKPEGETGEEVAKTTRGGKGERYEGKRREEAHPFDRKDGTGKAHRGDRKGGEGRGAWGDDKKAGDDEVADATAKPDAANPRKDRKQREERKERAERPQRERRQPVEEEKVAEPVVEEEEIGFTLDDFKAQKAAKASGVQMHGSTREHEKMNTKNISKAEDKSGDQFQATIDMDFTSRDLYKYTAGTGAELLGFQGPVEAIAFDDRKPRQVQAAKPKGNRKGGKMVFDDNEFPSF